MSSEDLLLCEDELLDGTINGQDEGLEAIEEDMNGEENSAEDFDAIRARVLEMEEEAAKLKQLQNQVDDQMVVPGGAGTNGVTSAAVGGSITPGPSMQTVPSTAPVAPDTPEGKVEADLRSIFVGNVDYGATAEELEAHFHGCGNINRVTIMCNKPDGHPKGFAYIEFKEKESVQMAMAMDESLFRGRQIKVNPKRTNKPGMSTTNRGVPRGRGSRGRVLYRGTGYMYHSYRAPVMRRPRSFRRAMYFPY